MRILAAGGGEQRRGSFCTPCHLSLTFCSTHETAVERSRIRQDPPRHQRHRRRVVGSRFLLPPILSILPSRCCPLSRSCLDVGDGDEVNNNVGGAALLLRRGGCGRRRRRRGCGGQGRAVLPPDGGHARRASSPGEAHCRHAGGEWSIAHIPSPPLTMTTRCTMRTSRVSFFPTPRFFFFPRNNNDDPFPPPVGEHSKVKTAKNVYQYIFPSYVPRRQPQIPAKSVGTAQNVPVDTFWIKSETFR